ncbi:MAG TPA: glycosyltransferase [Candidatus Omnitrophota bacterium]|nr:glycosyltransferase [Candidatus Omnitrophota bacterium]
MIVKNEQKMLEATLPNLASLVDEVILVDTGSTDGTKDIAKKYTSKIYDFSWINDFSAARNESLKYASGEWIIWPDADEFIKKEDMDRIKAAIGDNRENAFLLKVSECREGKLIPISYNLRPKLFRNGMGIHFERPINEQPFFKDGKPVAPAARELDIPIYHWGGFLSEDKLKQKKLRNIEILKKLEAAGKADSAIYLLLGMNYKDLQMYNEAVGYFDEVMLRFPQQKAALAAREERAWVLYTQKKVKEAYLEALEIIKFDPDSMIAANIIGQVFMAMGQVDKAIDAFKGVADYTPKSDAIIVSFRQKEYIANLFLSEAYLKQGQLKLAQEAAEKAYRFDPTDEAKSAVEEVKKHLK